MYELLFVLGQENLLSYCPPPFTALQNLTEVVRWKPPTPDFQSLFFLFDVLASLHCFLQALFTRDDDTSDEEEDEAEAPDVIAADELQAGGVSEIPGSKQR